MVAQELVRAFVRGVQDGVHRAADLWRRAVPIVIHGDGFPVVKTSLDTLSWCGFGQREGLQTLDSKILVSCLLNRCNSGTTKFHYWKWVVWAFAALMTGRFPSADCNGKDYAPGSPEGRPAESYGTHTYHG